jgi:hypothetical protein
MPTLYKAELIEPEPPMAELCKRMFDGLVPNARPILDALGYYTERDLQIPGQESELTEEEKRELETIAKALIEAAVSCVGMKDGVLAATLKRVAEEPSLFFNGQLPAEVQWQIATDYQRSDERSGTFAMDIWGSGQTTCSYPLETPTEANIKRAAEAALDRVQQWRRRGRPHHRANEIIALRLGTIFRSSGHSIVRRWQYGERANRLIQVEIGPFYDFLKLVLPSLNLYLLEQGRPPVTVESVVRLVTEEYS